MPATTPSATHSKRSVYVYARLLVACLCLLAAASLGHAQNPRLPGGLFDHAPAGAGAHANPAAARSRFVTFDRNLLLQDQLLLNLFDDAEVIARRTRMAGNPNGNFVWIGRIDGIEHSQVIIAYHNGAIAGSVVWPGHVYDLRPAGDGDLLIEEIDERRRPPHKDPLTPEGDLDGSGESANSEPPTSADTGEVIDVMVVYTQDVVNYFGGAAGAEAAIVAAVNNANDAYVRSQVDAQLRLVHLAQINYTETGDMSVTLADLRSNGDGKMDEAHSWRDTYGADVVSMISGDTNYCGIAYVMQNVSTSFAPYAFNVTSKLCVSSHTMAHEIGHNQGNAHDRANAGVDGAYAYSYGHQHIDASNSSNNFRTIMAYSCSGASCPRIPNFSNPAVAHLGAPTGIDELAPDAANNALSMNNTAYVMANLRPSATPTPPAAPDTLVATAASDSRIDLSWADRADNESQFDIERAPYGSGAWQLIATLGANVVSFSDTGLPASTAYEYRARASNGAGSSAWSNPASATTLDPLPFVDDEAFSETPVVGSVFGDFTFTTVPADVQQIAEVQSGGKPSKRYSHVEHHWHVDVSGGTSVTVFIDAWAPVSTDGDSMVFEHAVGNGGFEPMFNVKSSDNGAYQLFELPANVAGSLTIRVRDTDHQAGNTSLDSVYVRHLYVRSGVDPSVTIPAAPSNAVATADSASSASLVWDDNSHNEQGFTIYRSDDDGATWTQIGSVAVDVVAYTDTGLTPNAIYLYEVGAFNSAGASDNARSYPVQTPEGFSLSAFGYKVKGKQTVDLSWSGMGNETSVQIFRNGAPISPSTPNDGSETDAIGVKGGGAYQYRVCTMDGAVCSDVVDVVF